jgi:hypothetical protein
VVKRIVPCLVALAIAGAPVAFELCQIACADAIASSATSHAASGGAAPCHEHAQATGSRVSAAPHACAHERDQPAGASVVAARDTTVAVSLALLVATIDIGVPLPTRCVLAGAGTQDVPAPAVPLAVPLRI